MLPEWIDPNAYEWILAADKGYLYCRSCGLIPDVFVGDCDSLPSKTQIEARNVFTLSPIKDMTDTQEAVDIAIAQGATHITILGALGGRIDHTLANIHLLRRCLDKGVFAELVDETSIVTVINRPQTFAAKEGFCLSAIPLTRCEHVSESGVFYPLENAVMDIGTPYGISNEFTEDTARIDPGNGYLIVMLCKENDACVKKEEIL